MINIAVTGLNAVDSPAPGVPVIRCLKEDPGFNGRVIGLAYDALEPGILSSDIVEQAYLMPYPSTGKDALLERILYIHDKERLDVIIPCLDSELMNFARIKKELISKGIKLIIPEEEHLKAVSKVNLTETLAGMGVRSPVTHMLTDLKKIEGIGRKTAFPVLVKGRFYEAYKAFNLNEVLSYSRLLVGKWGFPVIIQEFIKGEEFNAAALGDTEGDMAAAACMKKLVVTDKGKGWACVSIINPELIEIAKNIISSLSWQGPLEIEAVKSEKDGGLYIIEVNPRFPAWIYLAKASGLNLPYMYLQMILGNSIKNDHEYRTGVVFSNITTNVISDIQTIEGLFTAGEISYEKSL
jgi:carbamoyl-phosphate synthase large subunit